MSIISGSSRIIGWVIYHSYTDIKDTDVTSIYTIYPHPRIDRYPHNREIIQINIINMTNLTLENWLDLAPCPPVSSPGLLYSIPYPANLTTKELGRIAVRCNVPPREQLASRQSGVDPPEVLLIPLLLSLVAVVLVVFIILGILYK